MMIWEISVYGAVCLALFAAMSVITTLLSRAFIGRENWVYATGGTQTLEHHHALWSLFINACVGCGLAVIPTVHVLRKENPLDLFAGSLVFVWISLMLIVAALNALFFSLELRHEERRRKG